MIKSVCLECGSEKSFNEDKLGKKFKCPNCGNIVQIIDKKPRFNLAKEVKLTSATNPENIEKPIESNSKDKLTPLPSQLSGISKIQSPVTNLPAVSTSPLKLILVAASLIILTGGVLFYLLWLKPYYEDKNAKRYYTYVDNLIMRSSQVVGVDYNILQKLNYGTELIAYNQNLENAEWIYVKANEKKGYISTQFMLNKRDFYELNGIFGDAESKEVIYNAKCRKALLTYFQDSIKRNIMGKIDPQIQLEIYGTQKNREIWQVFSRGKDVNPNTVAYPRITNTNSKFSDFACIIKNISTNKRKLLIFSFSESGVPNLTFELDAPDEGLILSITRPFRNGNNLPVIKYTN